MIHEALIDPDGPDLGHEWIELLVTEEGALDGSSLWIRNTFLDDPHFKIPLSGYVEAHSLLLISDTHPAATPFGCDQNNGCLRNTGGVIELRDCAHELVDYLAWGSATPDRQNVRSGWSLAWCDTHQRWGHAKPSPAAPTIEWRSDDDCPPPCEPPEALWINEVLYDPLGADGGKEFIELRTHPHTAVDGVRLHGINGSNGQPLFRAIPLTGRSDADGFFLLGGYEIDDRDQNLPTQLQNGPEALWLEACDGSLLDSMTYGGWSEWLDPFGPPHPVLPEGLSLGRWPDVPSPPGEASEFHGMEATPKLVNALPVDLNGAP